MLQITKHSAGYTNQKDRQKFDTTLIPSGFQMTFENGNTISVQFGMGNYCNNKYQSKENCENAEIAIWNADGNWFDFGNDQVKGHCTPNEVAYYINLAATTKF